MLLSVIIVSYNTSYLLRKCLNKVYKSLSFGKIEKMSEILVVDNASQDDTVAMIGKNFPKVIIIKNTKNLGFARANNLGIKNSTGENILLLNSDTEVEKDALTKLLGVAVSDDKIGAVGGRLQNTDGSLQSSVGFFPSLIKVFFWMFFIDDMPLLARLINAYHVEDKKFYEKKAFVDWVTGACFLVKRKAIDRSGYLDENIFMYGEELELCYRIKKAGYNIIYSPQAKILHLRGGSSKEAGAGIVEEFKAIIYFYKKHKPSWQLPVVRLFLKSGALLRFIAFGIIGRYPTKIPLYAKAFKLA